MLTDIINLFSLCNLCKHCYHSKNTLNKIYKRDYRRLGGSGERLRTGLPRILLGEVISRWYQLNAIKFNEEIKPAK